MAQSKAADARFAHASSDARFKPIKQAQTKVAVDPRFQSMFDSKQFKTTYHVDKYGRKAKSSTSDDLKKYYRIDESDQTKSANVLASKSTKKSEKSAPPPPESDEDDDEDEEEYDESESDSHQPDYARGEGLVESSSESSDSELSEQEEAELDNELDPALYDEVWAYSHGQKVPLAENATSRLAVCNLDWENVRAVDLYVIFNSFKTEQGIIRNITVYPSDYGVKCMERERVSGPMLESDSEDDQLPYPEVNPENEDKVEDAIMRRYQMRKMRYYYAVVTCDSAETASHLYQQCDGVEFETTSNVLDLRFIPEDMTFDTEARDSAVGVPANYKPREFVTKSLQQSKVKLSWDDDDKHRVETLRTKFSKDTMKELDFQAYIASESSDSDDDAEKRPIQNKIEAKPSKAAKKKLHGKELDLAKKYRSLIKQLRDDEETESLKKGDQEMEITFEPGLKDKVEELVKKKQERDEDAKLTTWERAQKKSLEKKKAKRQARKLLGKQGAAAEDALSDDEDDVPFGVDMNDDYFASEHSSGRTRMGKKHQTKIDSSDDDGLDETARQKQRAELELLMMDTTESKLARKHFDMKEIMLSEAKKKKTPSERKKEMKKKMKKGKGKHADDDDDQEEEEKQAAEDDFEVDLQDPRFAALLESHQFPLDPTDPQFKRTKNMEKIIEARHKHRDQRTSKPNSASTSSTGKAQSDPSLKVMVDSIKRRAQQQSEQVVKKQKRA